MNAHSKTAREAFFLELGIYPLRYHLAMRRLMFLWHLLHRDSEELIFKIYKIQKCHVNKGDWAKIINEERSKYNILENNEEIAKMSKSKFRKICKIKIKLHASKYLDDMAKPHFKSAGIRQKSKHISQIEDFPRKMFSCFLN